MAAPVKTVDIRLRNLNTTDFLINFVFFFYQICIRKRVYTFCMLVSFQAFCPRLIYIGITPVSNSFDSDHPDKLLGQM